MTASLPSGCTTVLVMVGRDRGRSVTPCGVLLLLLRVLLCWCGKGVTLACGFESEYAVK